MIRRTVYPPGWRRRHFKTNAMSNLAQSNSSNEDLPAPNRSIARCPAMLALACLIFGYGVLTYG